jgi:hypothetical protein
MTIFLSRLTSPIIEPGEGGLGWSIIRVNRKKRRTTRGKVYNISFVDSPFCINLRGKVLTSGVIFPMGRPRELSSLSITFAATPNARRVDYK